VSKETRMEDAVNKLAREMADAISAAVAGDAGIGECRERAREAGYELQVSIEALIGFAPLLSEAAAPGALSRLSKPAITAHDRRFLRSLRIAVEGADE
jgi:hypothetical protein